MTTRALPILLIALSLAGAPFLTACWGPCEAGEHWEPYADDRTAVTLDADVPVSIPLVVSAPATSSMDSLAVQIATTDCAAGSFRVGAVMRRGDSTEVRAIDGFITSSGERFDLQCPNRPVVFEVAPGDLTCSGARCTATLTVEVMSTTGVGPREIEAHLVTPLCRDPMRGDGAIDAFGP